MASAFDLSTEQAYTLTYLLAHFCFCLSFLFFFSRTLPPRRFVKTPFLCSLPFAGGIVLYTFVTGDARSASFQFIFYWAFAAADLLLYRERFWKRLGNFFFIVICLGIVEFAASLVYYVIVFLSGFRDFGAFDPVVPEDTPGDLLIFISFMSIAQFLVLPLCIYLWRHSVQHIHLKTLIQLVLAASLSGSGILYVFPEWIGPMGWIFVFIGTFLSVVLFFYGIRQMRLRFHVRKKEKEMLRENMAHYHAVWEKNLSLRRQNHDVAGHLQAISYLLKEEKTEEAKKYIHDLLKMM